MNEKTVNFIINAYQGIENKTNKHYQWEKDIFGEDHFCKHEKNYDKMQAFVDLLCESFGVPKAKIVLMNFYYPIYTPLASSNPLDGNIQVYGLQHLHPFIIIHEFCHWYAWFKFKNLNTHGDRRFMKFQRRLVWLTRKYWSALV